MPEKYFFFFFFNRAGFKLEILLPQPPEYWKVLQQKFRSQIVAGANDISRQLGRLGANQPDQRGQSLKTEIQMIQVGW
jgi:hypothetical protein